MDTIARTTVAICTLFWCSSAVAQGPPDIQWMVGGHGYTYWNHTFTADGSRLFTSSHSAYQKSETVKLFDMTSSRWIRTVARHDDAVTDVALSPDETRLATSSRDGTVRVWEIETADLLYEVRIADNHVPLTVAISPDGSFLAAAGFEHWSELSTEIHILSLDDGRPIRRIRVHGYLVYSIRFCSDNLLGFSTFPTRQVGVVDVTSGTVR